MTIRKKVRTLILGIMLVAGMVSCENWMIEQLLDRKEYAGGGSGGGSNVAVERVEITNGTARGGGEGSVLVIKTEVYPAAATNREVEWSSSDSNIADVVGTASGATVHLLKAGSAEIRVKPANGGNESVCRIDVVSASSVVDVTSVELSASTLSLQVGGHPVTLIATVLPANATDKGIEWSSSEEGVVKVDKGMVTARAAGTATITAISVNGKSASCEVEVAVPVNLPAIDTYRYIPGGTIVSGYKWGGTSGDGTIATSDISVAPFHIGKTAVRYELWYIVREWGEGHGYTFANKGKAGKSGTEGAFPIAPGKDEPVTMVSWRDVVVWCNAYSEITGKEEVYRDKNDNSVLKDSRQLVETLIDETKIGYHDGYRLPMGTEWEYAARGGVPSSSDPWAYQCAGSNTVDDVSWYSGNSGSDTHPVGQKAANSAGLYDMSGNVWEWCFESLSTVRVVRGGSWYTGATFSSVAYHAYYGPGIVRNDLGFRPVCR
ncbi:MAG: SUMF1/EgtB/PvdO family nonheme iron enzyme [Spirochaetaceae bacterium]|jgi:formylglycine-generating enzyme required for sulfatase activity|nr:SUMF1/EgtB/PvdO family nonheme iron enzyme [Spirochaetaceae bacterium]